MRKLALVRKWKVMLHRLRLIILMKRVKEFRSHLPRASTNAIYGLQYCEGRKISEDFNSSVYDGITKLTKGLDRV